MSDKKKSVIGFRICGPSAGYTSEYRHLTVQVGSFAENDAGELVRQSITHQPSQTDYYLAKARRVAEAGGDTIYYHESYSSSLCFKWQDDRGSRDAWYGIDAEFKPTARLCELLNKLRKAAEKNKQELSDLNPRRMVEFLLSIKAVPLKYVSDSYGDYVRDREFDLDKAIPAPAPKEQPAEPTVAETPAEPAEVGV